jgi:hypothetical protein
VLTVTTVKTSGTSDSLIEEAMDNANEGNMNKYWARWVQVTADYRPLIDEFEYWCSGWSTSIDEDEDRAVLCCLIEAESEEKAMELISHGWPEKERENFTIEEQSPDWEPSDRFSRKHKNKRK